jgi:hypothetical protein
MTEAYSRAHIVRGEQHHSWKHGLWGGYKRITTIDQRRMQEHRYIYEQSIGRRLKKQERIHHIDFNKLNNNIDNLVLFKNNGEHRKCHMDNIEKCALFFLNRDMWFSFKENRYVLEYTESCIRNNYAEEVKFEYIKKIRCKYGGIFCKYLDVDGKYKKRQEHIIIMEKILGRKLYQGENVHHIDGNKYNNDVNNLVVLNKKQHYEAHYSIGNCLSIFFKNGLVGFDKETKSYFVKINN